MKKILEKILDMVFPTDCIVCNKQDKDICASCLSTFQPPKPSEHPWIKSLWNYKDPQAEKVIRHIKNIPNKRAARIISRHMTSLISPDIHVTIVCVPISRSRFRERGYNQSFLIARELGKHIRRPVLEHALVKKKKTLKQGTTSSKQERVENMKDAFSVTKKSLVRGKDILVVDDVVTTGSTLSEIRKTLLTCGARSVSAITIAN